MFQRFKNIFIAHPDTTPESFLDDPKSSTGRAISNFIHALVFIFILVFCLETVGINDVLYQREILIFDAFVSVIFGTEYFYRFFKARSKGAFLVNPLRLIDLLSFLPFFIGVFAGSNVLIILRLFRIFRVLRIVKKIPLTAAFVTAIADYRNEYKAVFLLFIIILFLGSSSVYFMEYQVDGTKFTSIPITLWWGLVTMTTVGFGDMYPMTNMWKIVGSSLVLFGPLMLALISAVTIAVFQEASKNEAIKHPDEATLLICPRCKSTSPKEANYCMNCGKGL